MLHCVHELYLNTCVLSFFSTWALFVISAYRSNCKKCQREFFISFAYIIASSTLLEYCTTTTTMLRSSFQCVQFVLCCVYSSTSLCRSALSIIRYLSTSCQVLFPFKRIHRCELAVMMSLCPSPFSFLS